MEIAEVGRVLKERNQAYGNCGGRQNIGREKTEI